MTGPPRCEACLTAAVDREIVGGAEGPPYRLCYACATRLEKRALRPLEWYRLAALHGPFAYPLRDDFYEDDGTAGQPKMAVERAALFPAPTLREVSADLDALLDHALTRWHLDDDEVAALKAHPADALLRRMSDLIATRPIAWVEVRSYRIAARVLGAVARGWLEARWEAGSRPATLAAFIEAAAACLPHEDALPRALAALEGVDGRELAREAMALAWFRSPRVLDWIEAKATSPVSGTWGRLAACSSFGWPVATRWLDAGRPLSLVALDALSILMRPAIIRPFGQTPRLLEAPSRAAILEKLHEHALRDPVPRVTRIVGRIGDIEG